MRLLVVKKKKKACVAGAVAALLAAVVAALVFFLRPADYTACVPADAKAVAVVSPSALSAKGRDAALHGVFGGVTPRGIDFTSDIILFVAPNEYAGVAAAVTDRAAVEATFAEMARAGLCGTPADDGGRGWVWLKAGWLVEWDGRRLLALGPGVPQERDALLRCAALLMDGEGKSFFGGENHKRLERQRGGVRLFASLDAVPAPYNLIFRLALPPECPLSAVRLFAGVETGKDGKGSCATCELSCATRQWDEVFARYERGKGCLSPQEGDNGSPVLFRLATRTSGGDLLRQLRSDATLRGLLAGLNRTVDADKMLRGADGVAEFAVGSLAKDWTPAFCLRAENAAPTAFDGASYWMESAARQHDVRLERHGAEAFSLKSAKGTLHFGRNAGRTLYFASDGMDGYAAGNGGRMCFVQTPYRAGGLRAYLSLDLDCLRRQPCMAGGGMSALLRTLLPDGHRATVRVLTDKRVEAVVE